MKRLTLFCLLMTVLSLAVFGEKKFKPLKEAIKTGRNLDKAMGTVKELEKDSTISKKTELLQYGFLIQSKLYGVENEKLYLKQKYDTLKLFATLYEMFSYANACAALEYTPNEKGVVKVKYSKKNYTQLLSYYPNLQAAGRYYFNKQDYTQTVKYLSAYIAAPQKPLFVKNNFATGSVSLAQAAYILMLAHSHKQEYADVIKHKETAYTDTTLRNAVLEVAADAYEHLNNVAQQEATLLQGLKLYPDNAYFYTNLTDLYWATDKNEEALRLTDSLVALYPSQHLFSFGKSVCLFKLKRYEECIALSQELLAKDSTVAELYFNVGACYVNLAQSIEEPDRQTPRDKRTLLNKRMQYYHQALPYMEAFRRKSPEEQSRWAPLLYRIYLNLNMGKEFEQIDKLLKQMK